MQAFHTRLPSRITPELWLIWWAGITQGYHNRLEDIYGYLNRNVRNYIDTIIISHITQLSEDRPINPLPFAMDTDWAPVVFEEGVRYGRERLTAIITELVGTMCINSESALGKPMNIKWQASRPDDVNRLLDILNAMALESSIQAVPLQVA